MSCHDVRWTQVVHRPALVVFSGIPGTGKTTLAEHAARWLAAPLFGKDELEPTLRRSGIAASMNSGWAAYELLNVLHAANWKRGQSAILDSLATHDRIRERWRSPAAEFGACLRVIETVCTDGVAYRARLAQRKRYIPDWPRTDLGRCGSVAERYEPWTDARLVLDATDLLEVNLRRLRGYLVPSSSA